MLCIHRLVLPISPSSVRLLNMSTSAPASSTSTAKTAPLVMQLIVNSSLLKNPEWTMGPMMAQAAHASTAIIAQTYSSTSTQSYVDPINRKSMRKVVLQTDESLFDLSQRLQVAEANSSEFPLHHLWIEEPEHIPTVLAIAPNIRPSALKKILSKCSLLRN